MLSEFIASFKAARLERKRARKFARRQAWSEGLSVEETFDKIYTENKWGRARDGAAFYSGDGSAAEKSAAYEKLIGDFLTAHPELQTLTDIGCGDFQVSGRILARVARPVRYCGCDVSPTIVAHNQKVHAREGVRFERVNAVDADPPAGDVVTIRQVLQHLSNEQIGAILARLPRLYKVAIITESLPVRFVAANLDIRHGIAVRIPLGSGVYIDQPPYNLAVSEAFDSPYSEKEFLRTSIVWLNP
jgi:SAM-dependent methyltransferase